MTYILSTTKNEIYPDELKREKENEDPSKVLFLELSIEVQFDKRDPFPFYINRMPHLDTNILFSVIFASIGSETLCIARATTNLSNMSSMLIFCKYELNSKIVNAPFHFIVEKDIWETKYFISLYILLTVIYMLTAMCMYYSCVFDCIYVYFM